MLSQPKSATSVAKGPNKEDFEFSSHRSIIDEIVGKGYGHTESGERLLRMHVFLQLPRQVRL